MIDFIFRHRRASIVTAILLDAALIAAGSYGLYRFFGG